MHDLGFKFNSKERPGLSGNRFFEIKKITFSSGHKPFKKALHIVTTVEKFTFCGLIDYFTENEPPISIRAPIKYF